MVWNIFSFSTGTPPTYDPPDVELGGISNTPRHKRRDFEPLAWSPTEQLEYYFATRNADVDHVSARHAPGYRGHKLDRPSRHKLFNGLILLSLVILLVGLHENQIQKATTGLIKSKLDKTP
jgi:hypothetical protein